MKINDIDPIFVPGNEGHGSGEAPVRQHWRVMFQCNDGEYIHGFGLTKDKCLADAESKRNAHNAEITLPPKEQIAAIMERVGKEKIYDKDVQKLLRLMSKVILAK